MRLVHRRASLFRVCVFHRRRCPAVGRGGRVLVARCSLHCAPTTPARGKSRQLWNTTQQRQERGRVSGETAEARASESEWGPGPLFPRSSSRIVARCTHSSNRTRPLQSPPVHCCLTTALRCIHRALLRRVSHAVSEGSATGTRKYEHTARTRNKQEEKEEGKENRQGHEKEATNARRNAAETVNKGQQRDGSGALCSECPAAASIKGRSSNQFPACVWLVSIFVRLARRQSCQAVRRRARQMRRGWAC